MTNEQKEVATRQQKESKAGHTPTPWYNTNDVLMGKEIIGADALDGRYIADLEPSQRGDAEFIVRAVNSHEELLNFVKFLLHDNHIPSTCKKSGDDCLKCMAMDIIGKAEEKKS